MQIEATYCIIDEILSVIMPKKKIGRKSKLSPSEAITLLIEGKQRGYALDKQIYQLAVSGELRGCFRMPSYAQFNRALRANRKYFEYILEQLIKVHAGTRELYIIDSTALPINQFNGPLSKWGLGDAKVAKNMHGWYQGYKLHIITNDQLEIASVLVTKANFHDVKSLECAGFIKKIQGKLVGDRGYLASEKIRKDLLKAGIEMIAKQRTNMDPYLNEYYKKLLAKRRNIERVFAYLKRSLSALHKFARSSDNFLAHVLAALIVYIFRFTYENKLIQAFV
jgi:hypothetical protein